MYQPARTHFIAPATLIALIIAGLQAAVCTAGTGAASPQDKRESALSLHSDLVVVTVTVTDSGGRYVQGLKTEDFALVEDGKPQVINSFVS